MLHIGHRLGNIHLSSELQRCIAQWQEEGLLDEVTIDERDTRKSRLRLLTFKGHEIGFILPHGAELLEGDVFTVEEENSKVIVHISLQEVMVLTPLASLHAQERWAWAVRLGHVLGNQHWPLAVVREQIFTPVSIDRAVMETVLRTHHVLDHFSIHYERRSWPKDEGERQWTRHHS